MSGSVDDGMLLIVGGGRMGEALLSGLLAAGRPAAELVVAEVSPSRRQELAASHPGVAVVEAIVPAVAAVLVIKPGDVADTVRAVADAGARVHRRRRLLWRHHRPTIGTSMACRTRRIRGREPTCSRTSRGQRLRSGPHTHPTAAERTLSS